MPSKLELIDFINKANIIHNNKYSYDKTIYYNMKTNIIITCPIHGDFEQRAEAHIFHKCGCQKCAQNQRNRKHVSKYISKYVSKYALKTETINLLSIKYPNCNFSNIEFEKTRDYIEVECNIHGTFRSRLNNMLYLNRGCPKCGVDNQGWNKTSFNKRCSKNNSKNGIFYILKCFNENETFYKIGITSNSVSKRYQAKKDMPYTYDILYEYSDNPINIWSLEKRCKHQLKNFKYIPNIEFAGSKTECFSIPPIFLSQD